MYTHSCKLYNEYMAVCHHSGFSCVYIRRRLERYGVASEWAQKTLKTCGLYVSKLADFLPSSRLQRRLRGDRNQIRLLEKDLMTFPIPSHLRMGQIIVKDGEHIRRNPVWRSLARCRSRSSSQARLVDEVYHQTVDRPLTYLSPLFMTNVAESLSIHCTSDEIDDNDVNASEIDY